MLCALYKLTFSHPPRLSLPPLPASLSHSPPLPLFQSKLESEHAEAYVTISTLQEERVELLALKDALQKYIRQLEQNNDDLERGKRWGSVVWTGLSLKCAAR